MNFDIIITHKSSGNRAKDCYMVGCNGVEQIKDKYCGVSDCGLPIYTYIVTFGDGQSIDVKNTLMVVGWENT